MEEEDSIHTNISLKENMRMDLGKKAFSRQTTLLIKVHSTKIFTKVMGS